LLAKILLAQSKISDSKVAANHALSLAGQTKDFTAQFEAHIAVALTRAAEGRVAEAMKGLERVRAEASHRGYLWFDFEARLELGKLELHSGKSAAGQARLEQLANDARSKGFILIASQADNLARAVKQARQTPTPREAVANAVFSAVRSGCL